MQGGRVGNYLRQRSWKEESVYVTSTNGAVNVCVWVEQKIGNEYKWKKENNLLWMQLCRLLLGLVKFLKFRRRLVAFIPSFVTFSIDSGISGSVSFICMITCSSEAFRGKYFSSSSSAAIFTATIKFKTRPGPISKPKCPL